jgi:isopenicillin-N epimerase
LEDVRAFGRSIRQEWLLEEGMVFLNHGSFGATPRRVLAAQSRWRTAMERQPVRFFLHELAPLLRAAAADLATELGAHGEDLAFVENATGGCNSVLRSLRLDPGDEIVATGHTYPAVDAIVRFVCERSGAVPIRVDLPFPSLGPEDAAQRFIAALTDRTRLVVISHITSATALILPIEPVIAACRERGIGILVDGAHAPGMLPLDLNRLGADWYTGNAHKWLNAPKGCAFLWTNPDSRFPRRDLHPPNISLNFPAGFPEEFDWVGTRDPSAWLSVTAALAFLRELDLGRVRRHNHELVLAGGALLCDAWQVEPPAPPSMTGSILTLPYPGPAVPTREGCEALRQRWWREHRVEVMPIPFGGRVWVRVSAQIYNELDDFRRFAEISA